MRSACLLLLAGIILVSSVQAVAGMHPGALNETKTFILPVLRFGPSNQKRDLRYFLALAKELDAGIIPVGVYKHFLDRFSKRGAMATLMMSHKRQKEAAAAAAAAAHSGRRRSAGATRRRQPLSVSPGLGLPAEAQGAALQPEVAQGEQLTRGRSALEQAGGQEDGIPYCLDSSNPQYMGPDILFSWDEVSKVIPVATVEDLKQLGWDGQIELVLHSNSPIGGPPPPKFMKFLNMSLAGTGTRLAPGVRYVHQEFDMQCQAELIASAKNQIKGVRVVAVMSVFLTAWTNTMFHDFMQAPTESCLISQFQAQRLMRPSRWLMELADKFVKEKFGEAQFVSVHVRPYPDKCIVEWMKPEPLDLEQLKAECFGRHYEMHQRLTTCVAKATASAGRPYVFVMSHPDIRARVSQLFQEANTDVSPVFMDKADMVRLAGCTDDGATFLAMVEDAIAAHPQSHTFLGTAMSSVTESIIYERLGMGNENHMFLDKGNC